MTDNNNAAGHIDKEFQPIFYNIFFFVVPDKGEEYRHNNRKDYHRIEVTFKDHFRFPLAISKAFNATR